MIKRYFLITISLLLVLSWTTGCTTLKNTFSGTSSSKSSTSSKAPKDKTLYSRVPAAMRAPVKEATYDLRKAKADLKRADDNVKLAELLKQQADLEKKHADYSKSLAATVVEKAEIIIERKKLEAIDNANLGDKASNIKEIAKLKTKELGVEADYIDTRASIATVELEIKKLKKKVRIQMAKVGDKRR